MKELKIPFKGHYTEDATLARLQWLQDFTQESYPILAKRNIKADSLYGNIENFVGSVEVPIGIAGPLNIKGKYANGKYVFPMATTEGALVASICRGAKAINLCDGVTVVALSQQMMRSPVFELENLVQAIELEQWLQHQIQFFNELIEDVSSHAKLIEIQSNPLGRTLYVNFVFQTGDASGQNMSSACTWKICEWIQDNCHKVLPSVQLQDFFITSNASGAKKVTNQKKKGIHVVAEAFLDKEIIQEIFHCSPNEFIKAYYYLKAGANSIGSLDISINVVNVLAGVFTATGQDIASVHESALAQLELCKEEEGVYCTLSLPSLVIGTVGGGTSLANQKEVLKIMDCEGKDSVFKFAEIICSNALALELSTLGAIASNELVYAQEKLGRNRPKLGLRKGNLDITFFDEILKQANQKVSLLDVLELQLPIAHSTLDELPKDKKCVGIFGYELQYEYQEEQKKFNMVIKSKATSDDITRMYSKMAQACSRDVGYYFDFLSDQLNYSKSEVREIKVYDLLKQRRFSKIPSIYGNHIDNHKEIYWIALEDISQFKNFNAINDLSAWGDKEIKQVLQDLAQFHSLFYNHTNTLDQYEYIHTRSQQKSTKLLPLIKALFDHHGNEFSDIYTEERLILLNNISTVYEDIWTILEEQPKTLIHGACNPTNIAMRSSYETCIYDWETAEIHIPQHDLCEFLLFVLPTKNFLEKQEEYVRIYFENLGIYTRQALDFQIFWKGFCACHQEIALNRLNFYTMRYTFKGYEYLPRVLENNFIFLEQMIKQ